VRVPRERCISLWLLALTALPILSQPGRCEAAATPTSGTTWDEPLEEAVVDPTAILTQLRFLDFYSPGNSKTSAQTNDFLIQPIIPIGRLSFFPWEQIVRPTLKLSTLATGPSSHPITALSDTSLYHLITCNGRIWSAGICDGQSVRPGFSLRRATRAQDRIRGRLGRLRQGHSEVSLICGSAFCCRIRFRSPMSSRARSDGA
jgi:hypothetical protein